MKPDAAGNGIVQEAAKFTDSLARALRALGKAGEVTLGPTPKDAVYREDKLTLYHYRPLVERASSGTPLLICYALVNRPWMMDLQEDRSLIRGLLGAGIDVYLIDWGYPDRADRFLELDDYINRYLEHCVDAVCRESGVERVNLLGVCQGGTLSLCYTALHPERIRNLVTMVTPVDFHTEGNLLAAWARDTDVDALVAAHGNVPGELLNVTYLMLMPFRLMSQKYVGLLDIADDPAQVENFLRMEEWIFDSPDQPGEAFRQFVHWFYKENRLVRGNLEIGGRAVDLRRIDMPVLNVYATRDHLVPPPASLALADCVGSRDYGTLVFEGGHIGIYVSGKAQRELPSTIASWLMARE
jgi:poly[(R)-3-hydroxyalkanoate] polymerase subunit PhaC